MSETPPFVLILDFGFSRQSLSVWPWQSARPCLPSAGTKGMSHHHLSETPHFKMTCESGDKGKEKWEKILS